MITDLIAHGHTRPHCKSARKELDDECLKFENVFNFCPVKKADYFWDPGAGGGGLVEDERAAGHHEDDRVAHSEGKGTGKISFLQNMQIEKFSSVLLKVVQVQTAQVSCCARSLLDLLELCPLWFALPCFCTTFCDL